MGMDYFERISNNPAIKKHSSMEELKIRNVPNIPCWDGPMFIHDTIYRMICLILLNKKYFMSKEVKAKL